MKEYGKNGKVLNTQAKMAKFWIYRQKWQSFEHSGKNGKVLDTQANMAKFWRQEQEDFDFIGFRCMVPN